MREWNKAQITPDRWRHIEDLYHRALEHDENERAAFLRDACAGDETLQSMVGFLLANEQEARTFLDQPALIDLAGLPAANSEATTGGGQWTAAAARQRSLKPGSLWLRYRIVARIGAGGMGEVYRAVDTKLNRSVAIKFLFEDIANGIARERFQREAQMASALNHPHIVTVYDAGDFEGRPYLVTEYVDGGTLYDWKRAEQRAWHHVIELLVGVGDGLATAHEAGILHRDIKPANILVAQNGYAKLADFGLAKLEDLRTSQKETPPITQAGMILGTIAYMSPEQALGKTLDARSDIFSFGVTLYEMLADRRPFAGPAVLDLLQAIVHDSAEPLPKEIPLPLRMLVERSLSKDPDSRYQSMRELVADLKRSLREEAGPVEQYHPVVRGPARAVEEEHDETFVGREAELERLEQLLDQALAGSGRIVFITGEPGMGKTALAAEFLHRARASANRLIASTGRCLEQFEIAEAYLPFLQAIGELLLGRDGEAVASVLRTYAPTWCKQFPSVFGSADTLERLNQETIGATRERMVREMGDALAVLAARSPVVLLLEDLHWADSSSTDLIRLLGQRIDRQRILLIGTYRPEEVEIRKHPLRNYKLEMQAHNQCEDIPLGLLGIQHLAKYLDARCAPNDFPPDLAAVIERKTEGHPLFATSVVQFFIERGYLSQAAECWTLARSLTDIDIDIPVGVRSMIRKKIESLSDDDRRALQYASVEGEEFTSAVLAGLLGVDELLLEERLDRLDKVHRLIDARGEEELPDGSLSMRYRFSHGLYQNQLYEDLVNKRKIALHLKAGELLLERYGERSRTIAVQLAVHFERGRDFGRAVEHLIQSGDNAADLFASPDAAEYYSRALGLIERLPAEEQRRIRMTVLQKRGAVHHVMSRLDQAIADFTSALDEAGALNDREVQGALLIALCHTLFFAHRLDEMAVRINDAMRLAEESGNEALRAWAMGFAGRRHGTFGYMVEAIAELDECIRLATALQHKPALLTGLSWRGLVHFFQSEYESAEDLLIRAHRLSLELRDVFTVMFCLYFLGLTRAELGRLSEALAILDEAVALSRRNGDRNQSLKIPNAVGWIYREMGDVDRALEHDTEGVRISRLHGVLEAEINSVINLGYDRTLKGHSERQVSEFHEAEALLKRDDWLRWRFNLRFLAGKSEYLLSHADLAGAEQCARDLLENATQYGANKYVAVAHKLLAETACKRGDHALAIDHLNKAVDVLARYPTPIVAWKVYAALGRVLLTSGDEPSARNAFRESMAIVDRIARNISEEALRNTFLNSGEVRQVRALL